MDKQHFDQLVKGVREMKQLKTPTLVAHGRGAGENITEVSKWQRLLKLANTREK